MVDLLSDLNADQRHAVTHAGGPLLVLAGPGSGKTRVVTHRLAYRVLEDGADPRRLLAITFTNRAAREMRSRLDTLLPEGGEPRVGTFHWSCNAILRRYGERIGISRDFALLSPHEALSAFRAAAGKGGIERSALGRWRAAVSAMKNGAPDGEIRRRYEHDPAAVRALQAEYDRMLRRAKALDLDDLLWLAARLVREDEATRERCRRSLDELLVDEYQDTNPIQQELVELLCPVGRRVIAVGDDDQAIYGWRQAGSAGWKRFTQSFPDAETVTLGQSYRHSKHILRAAEQLINRNPDRALKVLRTELPAGEKPRCFVALDERDEAQWVARQIQALAERGVSHEEIAVLLRVNAQARALEDALLQAGIPYRVLSGSGFYERPAVRRVAAYLRLLLNPGDDAAAEMVLSAAPGIGTRRLQQLRELAQDRGEGLMQVAGRATGGARFPAAITRQLRLLTETLERERATMNRPLTAVLESAISAADDDAGPDDGGDRSADLYAELRELGRELERKKRTLRELVDHLSLHAEAPDSTPAVNLLTLHAAKGLEYRAVFLVGVEEAILPHRRSMDRDEDVAEERRLCYVGMTRAREFLDLSYAHARMLSGQALIGRASRFIGEIGAGNVTLEISEAENGRPRLLAVTPGERVLHPRWRCETVVAVQGSGRDTLVTIHFDEAGPRRLQLCHAPLRRLTGGEGTALAG